MPRAVTSSGSAATDTAATTTSRTASGSTTASPALPAAEIPVETAGPYPGDGSNGPDVLEQSGILHSDIRCSIDADGVPLTPVRAAQVDGGQTALTA